MIHCIKVRFLFGGQPAAGKDPLRSIIWEGITDPLPGSPHADLIAGSDCRDAPDMKQETAVKFRFPGLFLCFMHSFVPQKSALFQGLHGGRSCFFAACMLYLL